MAKRKTKTKEITEVVASALPPMRPYQEETVEFIKAHNKCAVTSAAGTGKTRCCIESWDNDDNILIICPAHLRETWTREINKWRPSFLKRTTIKSYDYFARLKGKVALPKYTRAVVDESTYIKAWTAKRTQVICGLVLPAIDKVTFLTASPIQKSAADLHPALTIKDRTTITLQQFQERYCNRTYDPFNGVVFTGVNPETARELRELWAKTTIKFTKQMVASDLPPIVEDLVWIKGNNKPDYDPATLDYEHATAEMKTEYQVIGMEKVPYVMEFIDSSPTEPTLIFCHHRRVNEEITAALKKSRFNVGQILGGDSKKDEKVVAFQEGLLQYLVISMEAGGTGLNLPRASRVIYAELPWTYVTYYQTMNRAHRLNTEHTVYVHALILMGTLDEGLIRTIWEKKGMSDLVAGEIDKTIKAKDHGKENTHTKHKTIADSHTGNIPEPSGASSIKQAPVKSPPREGAGHSGAGGDSDNTSTSDAISDFITGWGSGNGRPIEPANERHPATAARKIARAILDDLGLSLDDLGLGISAARSTTEKPTRRESISRGAQEKSFGQGACNPSPQCSEFLDELCRSAVLGEGLSQKF